MNAQVKPKAKAAKAKATVQSVQMQDGRTVRFIGAKHRLTKDVLINGVPISELPAASVTGASLADLAVRLDFRNGVTRTYNINPGLVIRYVAAGAAYKYGAALANEDSADLNVWAARTDALHSRLEAGNWGREGSRAKPAGNPLVAALMEFSGASRDSILAYLKGKSADEKRAIMQDERIKPIVERFEAARTEGVDTNALFAQLRSVRGFAGNEAT